MDFYAEWQAVIKFSTRPERFSVNRIDLDISNVTEKYAED